MSNRIILVIVMLFIGVLAAAQKSINDYKYVIVPLQYDFLEGKDKYRTSTLTRYLFKNEGFEVFFDEEKLPKDLFDNRCLALYADVVKVSKLFKNTVQIELNDCYGNLVFLSQEGSTKIKEYKKAFPVVIKNAFESIKALNYKYNPNSKVGSPKQVIAKVNNIEKDKSGDDEAKSEVEKLKKEVEELKKQKVLVVKTSKDVSKKEAVAKAKKEEKIVNAIKEHSNHLIAKPNGNGFEIVDESNRLKMILLKTAAPNVYTVKGKEAIVFKEGEKWYYSENNEKKELNIKF